MNEPHGLNDPRYAAFAWARYRRLMAWMALATVIIVAGAIGGFGGTAMLTAALMGLVFLSSGSGHDEDVSRIDDET